jgi:murein DD-endopeptidase MepM/ murein hydrolase activator NlpD
MTQPVLIGPLAVDKRIYGTVQQSTGDRILHSGYISSLYGEREPILLPNGYTTRGFHYGLDIAAPEGTPIYSPVDGVITGLDNIDANGGGKYVFIACGKAYGYEKDSDVGMLFLHCSLVPGKVGDSVKRGTIVGLVGETGWATGPHLHFEVRVQGGHVNPLDILVPHTAPTPVVTRSPSVTAIQLANEIASQAANTDVVPLLRNKDGRRVYNVIVP